MAMGASKDGGYLKLVCVGCKRFSAALIPRDRSALSLNQDAEAADNGLSDEEQKIVNELCDENQDTGLKN